MFFTSRHNLRPWIGWTVNAPVFYLPMESQYWGGAWPCHSTLCLENVRQRTMLSLPQRHPSDVLAGDVFDDNKRCLDLEHFDSCPRLQ